MISRLKEAIKVFMGLTVPGSLISPHPDDIFIVSFPKSGNTWTRFLLGNLICQEEQIDFANIEKRVPDIHILNLKEMRKISQPTIFKSHECFNQRYKKVIYIVRDPRDVTVSYYHYQIKIGAIDESYPISKFIDLFINGDIGKFGSWGENVGSWLGALDGDPKFHLVRYEDMIENAVHELKGIAVFLGIDTSHDIITRAVELSDFKRMQELEKQQSNLWKFADWKRSDIKFIRKGKSGNWQEVMSETEAKRIEDKWKTIMIKLDYISNN